MKIDKLNAAIARDRRLPRYICHLYQRLKANRLNLVAGAGISVDAKVPAWKQLLHRLAEIEEALAGDLKPTRTPVSNLSTSARSFITGSTAPVPPPKTAQRPNSARRR